MRNGMVWLSAHYQIGLCEDMKIIPGRFILLDWRFFLDRSKAVGQASGSGRFLA
jgi:hypothetical protein